MSSGSGMRPGRLLREQLAQHEREDAAVLVVVDLLGGVDAHARLELLVVGLDGDLLGLAAARCR